ncbi:MAG: PTS system mannose/fructose/sorbose family transporter subunit IID [Peptostreptococcaceae bacterium]
MESKTKEQVLTDKDLTNLALRTAFLQSSFNYQVMQGTGFCYSMLPELKKIHGDDKEKLSESMKSHSGFINTHPQTVCFLQGLMLSMEESGEDIKTVESIKLGMFPALGGIADSLLWFTLLPIMAGVCGSFATKGNILGPILYILVYFSLFFARIPLTKLGYRLGVQSLDLIKEHSAKISNAAIMIAMTVVGGLIASYVKIDVLASIPLTDGVMFSLQEELFNSILPNLLPFMYVWVMYYFLKKRKSSPMVLILATFVMSIVCSLLGIL